MKFLCEFKIKNIVDDFEIEKSVNDKGEETQVKKPVKKEVVKEFFIRKPNRILIDEAREFYSVEYSKAIKKGILPAALLEKRFNDDNGTLSEKQKKEFADSLLQLKQKNEELQAIIVIKEQDRTQEQKDKLQVLYAEVISLTDKIREAEEMQLNLFNQTAESYAKNKLIIWWLLNLSYNKDDDKPFFGTGDYEEKLKKYDELLEKEDLFFDKILKYFVSLVGFWFSYSSDKDLTQKDFDLILKILDGQDTEKST